MDTNYRIAYNKGWVDLAQKEPATIATAMQVDYNIKSKQFLVPCLQEDYIVDCPLQRIYSADSHTEPPIGTSILILHYLSFFQQVAEPTGQWVSLKEIPNGGLLFYPAFHKECILSLINVFGQNPALMLTCAKQLKGIPTSGGDASATFKLFPKIPLRAIIWSGDEEISANATILFDPSIEYFLHIESIIVAGSYLEKALVKAAANLKI